MNWRVFEVALKEDGPLTLHIVGYAWRTRDGRVTSSIQALDVQKNLAITESGRLYELCGEPGYRRAAEFVWQEWLGATGARLVREVTDEICRWRASSSTALG